MYTTHLRLIAALCLSCIVATAAAGNPVAGLVTSELLKRGGRWIRDQTISWGYGKAIDAAIGNSFEKELTTELAQVRTEIGTLRTRTASLRRATSERDILILERGPTFNSCNSSRVRS
ncbi:MAG TPA: hypothetical protein VE010_01360 [Thermoanaerobaculia bacterium]|nr:hypothetical protein [Thermoanaerobaculia bacterium]